MSLFSFPNPVDEVSARLVAAGAVVLSAAYVTTGWTPLVVVLAYGFVARLLTGPTLSPLGQLATRCVRPRLPVEARPTPGPPKRFAQGIGAVLSVAAAVAVLGFDAGTASRVLAGAITLAAALEAVLGVCLGCRVFSLLMRVGAIPDSVCEECNDLSARLARSL